MEIVNARPEHFPQIYSLICELEEASLDRSKLEAVYLRNLADPGIHYLIALETARPRALPACTSSICCIMAENRGIAGDRGGERTTGTGPRRPALLGSRKTAAAAGCLQLEVCCNRKRTDSHRFYERQGMAASHFKFTEVLGGQEQT